MKKIVTCQQMKAFDEYTISKMNIPSCVLMEKAAFTTVLEIEKKIAKTDKILVVCGSGNNGGDGIAIARILFLRGYDARIYFVGNIDKMTIETKRQYEIALNYRATFVNNPILNEYTTIVDAIFGVGLSRTITGKYAKLISEINQTSSYCVAVDIPSGINGDTGEVMGIAVKADMTVTFAYAKRGHFFYPGKTHTGKLIIADIGIYDNGLEGTVSQSFEIKDLDNIPRRKENGNKGTFGKVLVFAGSNGMSGASYLCSKAVMRSGAGMVKLQTTHENRIILQTLFPEAMFSSDFSYEENKELLNWCDVIVIGPGIGRSNESRSTLKWYLEHNYDLKKPMIIDADGLNILSEDISLKKYLDKHIIMTPHVGEMSRLSGKSISEIKENLVSSACDLAKDHNISLVLKDAVTVIAGAGGKELYINISGNSGMATAGSGDVLAGIIGGICGLYYKSEQKASLTYIAALGAFIHGLCGDYSSEEIGRHSMIAGDLIDKLPVIFSKIDKNKVEDET